MSRLTFLTMLILSGCQSTEPVSTSVRFAHPGMHFSGVYSQQLTVEDVRQIIALARDRRDILKPVDSITIERADEAEVTSGHPSTTGDLSTSFKVRKKNGRWFILRGSIGTGEVIITS